MKKLLPVLGLTFLAACTEKGFVITPRVEGGDTTYTAGLEAATLRKVVIEEFTGVTCPNCPNGHTIVANLQTQYPSRVVAISYYSDNLPQARPVEGLTKQDFRTKDATDVGDQVFGGVPGLPSAAIDRVPVNGNILPASNVWAGAVATRIGMASPANIQVTSDWGESNRTAIIKVRVAYTSAVAKKQALTVILTENGLVDAQEYPTTVDSFYQFKHVLRDIITPPTGEAILNELTTKEAGRVYERTFVYKTDEKWNPDNCQVVAILHNAEGDDKEVVQTGEGELKD